MLLGGGSAELVDWVPLLLDDRLSAQDADPHEIVDEWTEADGLHSVTWTTQATARQQVDAMALRVWQPPAGLLLDTGTHDLILRIRPVSTPTGASFGSLIMGVGWCGGNASGAFVPTRCRMAGFRQFDGSNFRLSILQSATAPVNNLTSLGKPTEFIVSTQRGTGTIGGISTRASGLATMESQGSALAPDGATRRLLIAFGSTSTSAGTSNTATFRVDYAYRRVL